MAFEDDILDISQIREIQEDTHYPPNVISYTVERRTRFGHLIIDMIARYLFVFLLANVVHFFTFFNMPNTAGAIAIVTFLLYMFYYPLMEYFYGKTIGKMILKSSVVDIYGSKITFRQAIGRSLCRWIPFEAFSFLGTYAVGWHDKISDTRVVRDDFLAHMLEYDKHNF